MVCLPSVVSEAWEIREAPAILTTVDEAGVPNSVYVGALIKHSDELFVIADNYFCKTRANVLAGSPGSLLFITPERKAYQVKGSLERQESGEHFERMKNEWNDPKHPGEAVVLLHVEEVFKGAEKLA